VADTRLSPLLHLGDWIEPVVQYDSDLGLWNVGVLERGGRRRYRERFTGALVDPVTGEGLAIIERSWVERKDPATDSF
jgi:hypothetical protein